MLLIKLVYIIILFIILSPGVFIKLPRKGSLLPYTIGHGIVFTFILWLSNKYIVSSISENFENTKLPNPNLIFNTGGPSWGQYVVNSSLLPPTIYVQDQKEANGDQKGNPFIAGNIPITPIVKAATKEYADVNTYFLGDIVSYKGKWYINLAWTDARGLAYSGSFQSSPDKDKNVWKDFNLSTIPEPFLNFNYGGPAWGQFVIKPNLVPDIVELSSPVNNAGKTASIQFNTSASIAPYVNENTYYLGDLVSFNGRNFINLAYKDPRGAAYSGSFQQSPDTDKNVWRKVKVAT